MTILSFWELPDEDQPPQMYWGDDDAIKEWFEAVKQRRSDPGGSTTPGEVLEDVPLETNEYARELLRGR